MTTIENNFTHCEEEIEGEDEWMEVYRICGRFGDVCGNLANNSYHHFRYYQCWGGGPEGGYITNKSSTETYRVNRGWGESFTIDPVDGMIEIGYHHDVRSMRIVPKSIPARFCRLLRWDEEEGEQE